MKKVVRLKDQTCEEYYCPNCKRHLCFNCWIVAKRDKIFNRETHVKCAGCGIILELPKKRKR